jgi:hypothetical protein
MAELRRSESLLPFFPKEWTSVYRASVVWCCLLLGGAIAPRRDLGSTHVDVARKFANTQVAGLLDIWK